MPPEPLPPEPLGKFLTSPSPTSGDRLIPSSSVPPGVLYVEPTYHSAGPSRGKLASLNVFTVGTDALVARFTPDFTHLANLLVATVNHKEDPSLFPSGEEPKAALVEEHRRYRATLEFYANRMNWTNHGDWAAREEGCVVLSRDATHRDMSTPGYTEAVRALHPEQSCNSPSSPPDPPAPSAPSTLSNPPAHTSASPPPATYDHPTLRNSLDTLDPPDPPRV